MSYINTVNTFSHRKLSKKEIIELSKFNSDLKKLRESKDKICRICGKKINGYCQSHSIPSFVLKSIANNGKVRVGTTFQSMRINVSNGVKNTLNFYSVCKKCDSEYFQNYEHEDLLHKKLTDVAINEIAIKSYIRYLYKQENEFIRYKELLDNKKNIIEEEKQFYENILFLSKCNMIDTKYRIDKYINKKNEKNFIYFIHVMDRWNNLLHVCAGGHHRPIPHECQSIFYRCRMGEWWLYQLGNRWCRTRR